MARLPRLPVPRIRFRLRGLLLMVLLAGAALGADRMRVRRAECLERAAHHDAEAGSAVTIVGGLAEGLEWHRWLYARMPHLCDNPHDALEEMEEGIGYVAGLAERHRRLADRYRRAASRPWGAIPSASEAEGDGPS